MKVEIQKVNWSEAYAGYHEARAALRDHPEAKHLKIAARAYFHMKQGRGVLDVFTAIKKAGLNKQGEPRLAIAPSDSIKGFFEKRYSDQYEDKYYTRLNPRDRWSKVRAQSEVKLPAGTFASPWPREDGGPIRRFISSPTPTVPPKLLPPGHLSGYFTMWEVDEWTSEPPVDPILLKRISPNLFIVLGSWDTTPLERSILRGMIS